MTTSFGITLLDGGIMPTKAHPTDACFDLYAAHNATIPPRETAVISLGVVLHLQPGWVGRIYARSGLGLQGLRPANCVGIIDAGYRGALSAGMRNDSNAWWHVKAGQRIAQLEIAQLPDVDLHETDNDLIDTPRGTGGFGSTGR